MQKKTVFSLFLISLLLAGLYGMGYYWAVRMASNRPVAVPEESRVPQTEEEVSEILLPLTSDIPIKKGLSFDNSKVNYTLEGYFESLEKGDIADSGSDYLVGWFVLKGDPLKRAIEVYIGSGTGVFILGQYEGSFQGRSTWRVENVNNLLPKVAVGEPVVLKFEKSLDSTVYLEYEKVLDNLYREYESGDFSLIIPADFAMLAEQVGVINSL